MSSASRLCAVHVLNVEIEKKKKTIVELTAHLKFKKAKVQSFDWYKYADDWEKVGRK